LGDLWVQKWLWINGYMQEANNWEWLLENCFVHFHPHLSRGSWGGDDGTLAAAPGIMM
jgi:hypothetical protein